MNRHTDWLTHRPRDGHKKEKRNLKNQNFVNVSPPDAEYLYYSLDVEGVSLKCWLLPPSAR